MKTFSENLHPLKFMRNLSISGMFFGFIRKRDWEVWLLAIGILHETIA